MDQMLNTVIEYTKFPNYGCNVTGMAELAPGVIAVTDDMGECDAYFLTSMWRFKNPEVWKLGTGVLEGVQKRKLREEHYIDILPGMGQLPPATTFDEMLEMAKMCLKHTDNVLVDWYDEPKLLEVA